MLTLKKSNTRGYVDHDWLKSYHTFSFASYYNPDEMNFSHLRVINDDIIKPNYGFGQHPHKNMEIFTYILSGHLEHKDTLGTGDIINTGDVQLMSTGYGVKHSEFNPSSTEDVHLLQIWIIPEFVNTLPTYQQRHFTREDKLNKLKLIISADGNSNSLFIKQDLSVYACVLEVNHQVSYENGKSRLGYLHLAKGHLTVNNIDLYSGDSLKINHHENLLITGIDDSEFLLFDLVEL